MRVWKNLFGTDGQDKIDAGEICNKNRNLKEILDRILDRPRAQTYYIKASKNTSETFTMRTGCAYIIMTTIAGRNTSGGTGAYFVWNWGGGYSTLDALKENVYVDVELNNTNNTVKFTINDANMRIMILEFGNVRDMF